MSDFWFSLGLRISPLQRLQSDEITLRLPSLLDGKDVVIASKEFDDNQCPRPFKSSTIFECEATGFDSYDSAKIAGLQLVDSILVGSAVSQVWIDVGRDMTNPGSTAGSRVQGGQSRLHSGSTGLRVHNGPLPMGFTIGYCVVDSGNADSLVQNIRAFIRRRISLDDRQRLALEIFGLAHFEASIRAQFVVLMSVVEVLADRQRREPELLNLLDSFIEQASSEILPGSQRDSLINGLRDLKSESISKACRNLVGRYLCVEDCRAFTELYNVRSNLLHTGNPPEGTDLSRKAGELSRLVSRLAQAIFLPGESQTGTAFMANPRNH